MRASAFLPPSENSLLIIPPLAWPHSAAARCSADLMQQKREQCRNTVCERSDGKPLDRAELSAPTEKLDKCKIAVKVPLTHSKTNFQASVEKRLEPQTASEKPPS
jgi:hypothetical protein